MGPMTKERADSITRCFQEQAEESGFWGKVCIHCGAGIGMRLAEYGKPTKEDLKYTCCPNCPIENIDTYDGSEYIRLEYYPGK